MDFTAPPPSAHPGILHFIPPNLSVFEPSKPLLSPPQTANTLLWIDGMYGTHLATSYPQSIAQALGPTWSVMVASLTSAGLSWGTSSIARDAEDMEKIVAYVKQLRPTGRVVIMGHSTGCQDCMEYVVGKRAETRPPVDGIILQAPVSDREGLEKDLPQAFMNEANQLALKMCREGQGKDFMPHRLTQSMGDLAITAKRWVDIASPAPNRDGADDYFSQDLSDERLALTFGRLPPSTPLLILYSGSDETVADFVDARKLVQRWLHTTEKHGGSVDAINSGIVEGASHNLNGQPAAIIQDLVRRVNGFVMRIEKGEIGVKIKSTV